MVISIIAILAGVVITSIAPARKKGRDAQRVSDLANIRIALAIYKSQKGTYPISDFGEGLGWAMSKSGSSRVRNRWASLTTELVPYLTLPLDPLDTGLRYPYQVGSNYHYAYRSDSIGAKYDLIAQFEDTKNPNRCEVKNWKRHTVSPESPWCQPWGGPFSPYLYADH